MRMPQAPDNDRRALPSVDRDAVRAAMVAAGLVARVTLAAVGGVVALIVLASVLGGCGDSQEAATTPPEAASTPPEAATGSSEAASTPPEAATGSSEAASTSPEAANTPPEAANTPSEAANTPSEAGTDEPFEISGQDFGGAVQPILEHKCASCHSTGGPGAEDLELVTAADAAAAAADIADAVAAGYMPPWPASANSVEFRYDRSLTDEQIEVLVNWGESGGDLDVPADTAIVAASAPAALPGAVTEYGIDPYQSQAPVSDDYRCFLVASGEAEERWVTGFELVPDQTENVHHAIVYKVDGVEAAQADTFDGADGQPGWTCYGQTGMRRSELLLGWAPGQDAFVADPGTAFRVQAESFLVMQVHYHFDGPAPVDQSTLKVTWGDPGGEYRPFGVAGYVGPVEIPCAEGEDGPLCDRDAAMAAAVDRYGSEGVRNQFINFACGVEPGDFASMTTGEVTSSCTLPAYGFGEIVSILGHEHELGSSFRLTLNSGGEQTVLLDIPDWDFDWQYQYQPVDSIMVESGDTITIECGWDRRRRDPSLDPSYVLWADGTSDEMCFATVVTVPPA